MLAILLYKVYFIYRNISLLLNNRYKTLELHHNTFIIVISLYNNDHWSSTKLSSILCIHRLYMTIVINAIITFIYISIRVSLHFLTFSNVFLRYDIISSVYGLFRYLDW